MEDNKEQNNNPSEMQGRPDGIKGIHTFQSDMANFVRNENSSVIDIAMAQNKKRETDSGLIDNKKSKLKNILLLLISLSLIAVAIFGGIFLVKKGKSNSVVKKEEIKIQTFVSYEDQVQLDLTNSVDKNDLSKKIREEVGRELGPGKIKFVLLNSGNIDQANLENMPLEQMKTSEFAKLAKINMPENLLQSLTDNFMVGVFSPSGNSQVDVEKRANSLFFIFQTKDYERTYAGMLDWEKTMLGDLFLFFNIDISGENQILLSTLFRDKIISNKDSRVLQNEKGSGVLYYLFIDTDIFIISENQNTIQEVLSRIIVKNIKPV